jgi:hypothetical protein
MPASQLWVSPLDLDALERDLPPVTNRPAAKELR